ncbi:hypothetical protein Sjap_026133 [Stephania japonica]|uniref:Leucine-rich repeat-containing N-terminal plant-type domain-containing protein n=1 Tax=Stephania japonica TaxID=461633 RepID=A0AAP0HI78_9MAGN
MSVKSKFRWDGGVGPLDGWDINSVDPCTWNMVACSPQGFVVSLEMANNGFSGTLSSSIANLSHLRTLLLQNNQYLVQFHLKLGSSPSLKLLISLITSSLVKFQEVCLDAVLQVISLFGIRHSNNFVRVFTRKQKVVFDVKVMLLVAESFRCKCNILMFTYWIAAEPTSSKTEGNRHIWVVAVAVRTLYDEKRLEVLVDRVLSGCFNSEELEKAVKVALLCTRSQPSQRPKMSEVVRILEGIVGPGNEEEPEEGGFCEERSCSFSRNYNDTFEGSSFIIEAMELSGPR